MKFKVPITWSTQSHVTVIADSRAEAADIAESLIKRPMGCYVEGSLQAGGPLSIKRILPRNIENPRNMMQPDIHRGDIAEVEENGNYYVLPMKEMTLDDEAHETGTAFEDVWYGRLIGGGEQTAWHWAESEEDILDELNDRYGEEVESLKLIKGGKA